MSGDRSARFCKLKVLTPEHAVFAFNGDKSGNKADEEGDDGCGSEELNDDMNNAHTL